MPEPRELMIIFGTDHSITASSGRYRVRQKVAPRVVIAELIGDTTKEELETLSGVDAEVPSYLFVVPPYTYLWPI